MKHTTTVKEFSRFAHSYNAHNMIQDEVAKTLVDSLPKKTYDRVIDIGCGSGAVFKYMVKNNIQVSQFIALDASSEMLALHPVHSHIEKKCADFNTQEAFSFNSNENSIIVSSSALQWSKDLDFTFSQLAKKSSYAYFAMFTANTFKTVHEITKISSPIYSEIALQKSIQKHYQAEFNLKRYKLHFSSVQEMFRYIKKSGVSGGKKQLSYKETKYLMATYPLDYLEFEVLFVKAKTLNKLV